MQLDVERPQDLVLHRRQAVRRRQADGRLHPRRAERPQRVDPAEPLVRQPRLERAGGRPARPLPAATAPPPASVEDAAAFVSRCSMRPASSKAALVGHSFGSLIVLEARPRRRSASRTWRWSARPIRWRCRRRCLSVAQSARRGDRTWSTSFRIRCWRRRPRRSARDLALRQLAGADAARAGEQPRGQPLPPSASRLATTTRMAKRPRRSFDARRCSCSAAAIR